MAAPLPQERSYREQLYRNRLAALRGDVLDIPVDNSDESAANNHTLFGAPAPLAANNTRFFPQDSEDGLLANYAEPLPESQTSANTPTIDPAAFSRFQQQARMQAGIGAPQTLPEELASLPDPEYSTEDEPITFGESMRDLEEQARNAETLEEAQEAGGMLRNKAQQAAAEGLKQLERMMKERSNRLFAQGAGNGANAVDTVGWDGWITFGLTYLYLMARGVVSVLAPESGSSSQENNSLHTLLPPYRPLQEPGDFLYFLFLMIVTGLIVAMLIGAVLFLLTLILFPAFMPGAATSLIS